MPYSPSVREVIKPLPAAYTEDNYSIAEVCELADLSLSGLRWLRANGRGPDSIVIGRRTAFPKASTHEWLKRRGRGA